MSKAQKDMNRRHQTLQRIYHPVQMLVHALGSMPAKNAGALVAVNTIKGAVPLIHGPAGCANMRQMNSFGVSVPFPPTPCTNLGELDVVFGGEKKLYRGIIDLYHRLNPALIVVVPTCPSDMMGDDLAGVVEKAKKDIDCEVIYSTGETIPGRPIGYHDVMNSVVDQLLLPKAPFSKIERSVNLISFPIDVNQNKYLGIVPVLEDMGIRLNRICFHNTSVSDLYELPKAELNVTDFPMPWVEKMKAYFGVDYLPTLLIGSDPDSANPYGIEGTARMLLNIAERLGMDESVEDLIKRKKAEAIEEYMDMKRGLEDVRIAVQGGFFMGLGTLLLRDLKMRLEVISYRSFFMKSHGASDEAYKQLIEMDLNFARKHGYEPKVLKDPALEEEIRVCKDRGVQLVICNAGGMGCFHEEGIRAFNGTEFFMQSLEFGFDSIKILIEHLIQVLNNPLKKCPLINMIEHDDQEPSLIEDWKKLGLIWRSITQGADGGCLYG